MPEPFSSHTLFGAAEPMKLPHLDMVFKKCVYDKGWTKDGGIKNTAAGAHAMALAEAYNIPVVSSPGHGDAVPFGHPLNAGQMGPRGNLVASRLVK
ncbi:MAG: hypothetical protein EBZ13_03355, partial [Planctomycetia bacterium]|nr:hypothetical protein [Planctomycetia bacterium]